MTDVEQTEQERIIEQGRETAKENLKHEDTKNREADEKSLKKNMDGARESAKLNHKVDRESQDEQVQNVIPANDTSKSAKEATAKAQLNPNGEDPISESEINKSATNADMSTGNKTAVSNQDAADRARNPGKAEEEAPRSTANPDIKPGQNATSEKVSEASTTNRDQARAGEERGNRPIIDQSKSKS